MKNQSDGVPSTGAKGVHAEDAGIPEPRSAGGSVRDLVNRIHSVLTHESRVFTSGDLAALRRMDPTRPEAPFFKLAGLELEGSLCGDGGRALELETSWAAIVVGLARLGSLHRLGVRLGASLHGAGFSELRLSRLLRADRERLLDELPALARFLSAKGVAADWSDAARLILAEGTDAGERARRDVARAYYRSMGQGEAVTSAAGD